MPRGPFQYLPFLRRRRAERRPVTAPSLRTRTGLSTRLSENLIRIKETVAGSNDIMIREFKAGDHRQVGAAIFYVEGMVDNAVVNDEILKTIMIEARQVHSADRTPSHSLLTLAKESVVSVGDVTITGNFDELLFHVLSGNVAVLFDGYGEALVVNAKGWEQRGVKEPTTQSIIRGPRDGFTETLRVNTALVRRRIRDPNLTVEISHGGRRTKTDIAILFIRGIANPSIVDEVRKRLNTIDIDAVLESGYIEQLIEDNWWGPFSTIKDTERPDDVVGTLLEGRVAIMVDNSPFALVVPATLSSFITSSEDYYFRWPIATLVRLLRYGSMFVALTLPAFYIALASYHPEMIPTELAISIAATRSGVPFPVYVEAFMMEIAIELLREAGIRLPGPIGQTIGIVGGLIVGEAAVQAGIVSPIIVIVVATTAIASFATPSYSFGLGVRILRFPLMVLAGALGLYGVVWGLLAILVHLVTLRSFGVGFMSPFTPARPEDIARDSLIRLPLLSFQRRPSFIEPQDSDRLDDERQNDRVKGDTFDNE